MIAILMLVCYLRKRQICSKADIADDTHEPFEEIKLEEVLAINGDRDFPPSSPSSQPPVSNVGNVSYISYSMCVIVLVLY